MNESNVRLLLFGVAAATLLALFWVFRNDILPPPREIPIVAEPEPVPEPVVEEIPEQIVPIHPLGPPEPAEPADVVLVPLPPLDDSDSFFLLALTEVFGPQIAQILVSEALIDKFVATVDNLTREHVGEKIRPVVQLPGAFVADASLQENVFHLSSDNYERYDLLLDIVANADTDTIVESYRRFYPLLQESYERLGYPNAYFNDRVVEVIDHLLETPEQSEPIRLVRPHVLYEFADAELESLSSGQKFLLRTGNRNADRIRQLLRSVRELIVNSPD